MPQAGAGSCQLGTVTQHPAPNAPTRPRPSSAGPAGPTGPSAARASTRRALHRWLHKQPANGVIPCPQYVGTCKGDVLAPFGHPDWAVLTVSQLKQMEVQLEEEYEDKQKVLREKRELESKLSAFSEQVGCRAARQVFRLGTLRWPWWGGCPGTVSPPPQANQRDFETEKRLRRDLKRTKALLADAQIMLDHLKNNAPSKREITQLKNQVCIQTPSKPQPLRDMGCSHSLSGC